MVSSCEELEFEVRMLKSVVKSWQTSLKLLSDKVEIIEEKIDNLYSALAVINAKLYSIEKGKIS